jgi:murein DD-endopeptidase MepM/ murein hydrolase activator NlpD
MRRHAYTTGTWALLIGLGGCASVQQNDWVDKAHDSSVKAVDAAADQASKAAAVAADQASKAAAVASAQASKALVRMRHYVAEKDLLKTFTDSGEHSESVVLDVLHKAGVSARKGGAPTRNAPAGSTGTLAGKGPPAKAAPSAIAPATAPTGSLPDQYVGTLQWPLEAGVVSSEYGERWGKMHKGIDIAADVGEPVYAIAPGEVIYAGSGLRGYGNVVILRHDRQRTSLYAHNSALNVKLGDMVARGAVVAQLGNTGHSTGPHVHFEIRDGDTPLNPRTVLPPTKLAGLIGDPGVLAALDPVPAAYPGRSW